MASFSTHRSLVVEVVFEPCVSALRGRKNKPILSNSLYLITIIRSISQYHKMPFSFNRLTVFKAMLPACYFCAAEVGYCKPAHGRLNYVRATRLFHVYEGIITSRSTIPSLITYQSLL
jgi:hypothetical protein